MMLTVAERFEAQWEGWYPTLAGFVTSGASYWFGPTVFSYMVKNGWAYEAVYAAAFGIASVTVPFLFTFYTIFVTTENGFIARMRRTGAYAGTVRSVLVAMILGAVVIAASVPMMVIKPVATLGATLPNISIALWSGLVALTLAAFVRAAHQFVIFISAQHSRRA